MSCRCPEIKPRPHRPFGTPQKGVVDFCDPCDPCNPTVSNVRLCAYVVPTLEDGRYYANSFVFVQDEETVYYISDNRSEIPFGSRPKFLDNFEPEEHEFKSTIVFDVDNHVGYVYDQHGHYAAIGLSDSPIVDIKAGEGILVEATGGTFTISADMSKLVSMEKFTALEKTVTEHTTKLQTLEATANDAKSKAEGAKTAAEEAQRKADEAKTAADLATQTANSTQSNMDEALASKQDKLTPGDGIKIEGNVISSTVSGANASGDRSGLMSSADRTALIDGFSLIGNTDLSGSGIQVFYTNKKSAADGASYTSEQKSIQLPLADDENAGLISPEEKKALAEIPTEFSAEEWQSLGFKEVA